MHLMLWYVVYYHKVAELLLLRQRVSLLQESLESQKQILDKGKQSTSRNLFNLLIVLLGHV